MVQVLENNRKPSFLTSVATGVSSQLPTVLQDLVSRKKEQRALDLKEKQNKALIDLDPGAAPYINHPPLLEAYFKQKLKDESNQALMKYLGILPKDDMQPSSQGGNIANLMQSLGGQGQQDQQQETPGLLGGSMLGALGGQMQQNQQNPEDFISTLMEQLSSQQPQQQPQMQQPMQPPMQQPQQFQPNQPGTKNFTPQQLAGLSVTNPQVANALMKQQEMEQKAKEFDQREQLQESKFKFQKKQAKEKQENVASQQALNHKMDIHKESGKYAETVADESDTAKKQLMAIENIRDSIGSEDYSVANISNIFRGKGKFGDLISDAFLSANQAKINASSPYLIEGWRDVFGVRLTDADLEIIKDKLPSITKSREANEAIIRIMEKYAKIPIQRNVIANRLTSENDGYRPLEFRAKVSDELEAWLNSMHTIQGPKTAHGEETVKIFDPKTNTTRNIPRSKYDAAIKAGGQPVYE